MGEQEEFFTYNLRSKRRKLNDGEEATGSSNFRSWRRKAPIMHVPLEILQNVFKFLTYQELSERVRRVNRKFKLAAEDLLNKTFKKLPKRLRELTSTTYQALEATQDDMEAKCLCRLLNALDILNFHQSVIMATIWRYVFNDIYRTTRSCMYAGLILDHYHTFLHKFITSPYQLYAPAVVKDYAMPDEVKKIIKLSKTFCIHFDKISEEPARNPLGASGCKIVDYLDAAAFARRTVIFEKTSNNTFSAKYCYFLHNAWFVAFGIPPDKYMPLKQKQRMMHMRIRRIILAHTEMFMQQSHYEREVLLRMNPIIKKPSVVVYTGYGDVHDTFFCYGAMNDAAYFQKFHRQEEHSDTDGEDEAPVFEGLLRNIDEVDNSNDFLLIPHLGLDIDIRIDCPLAYAPYRYIRDHQDVVKDMDDGANGVFNLSIEFNCPGAYYPRLPPTHKYYKRISTRQ